MLGRSAETAQSFFHFPSHLILSRRRRFLPHGINLLLDVRASVPRPRVPTNANANSNVANRHVRTRTSESNCETQGQQISRVAHPPSVRPSVPPSIHLISDSAPHSLLPPRGVYCGAANIMKLVGLVSLFCSLLVVSISPSPTDASDTLPIYGPRFPLPLYSDFPDRPTDRPIDRRYHCPEISSAWRECLYLDRSEGVSAGCVSAAHEIEQRQKLREGEGRRR